MAIDAVGSLASAQQIATKSAEDAAALPLVAQAADQARQVRPADEDRPPEEEPRSDPGPDAGEHVDVDA